ncbi:MAG: phosphate-starvation-inducible PsiE family protein [Thiobacillaceae bacterium]|nr:phosphate-starvation-inducible PsiE family protein [Thiobacillaceae bacterium]MDW8323499.1 phosphate-starvation-inducible PsiE family protein [Burkholderiales bacterium]
MDLIPSSKIALTLLHVIEQLGLLVIVVATIVAGVHEVGVMIDAGTVTLADLLLMFLYLEILAMVGVYYRSGKLPVRFPIYIAIVALARFIVLDIKNMELEHLIAVSAAILLLALAVLAIRYGHVRFPYGENE